LEVGKFGKGLKSLTGIVYVQGLYNVHPVRGTK
jgi:hypothetical protein